MDKQKRKQFEKIAADFRENNSLYDPWKKWARRLKYDNMDIRARKCKASINELIIHQYKNEVKEYIE